MGDTGKSKLISYYVKEIGNKKNNEITRKTVGPMAAGVYNKKTGTYHLGLNEPGGNPPVVKHPLIDNRVANMPDDIKDSYVKTSGAGSHAECNGLNDALIEEYKVTNNIEGEVTQEMLNNHYGELKDIDISHLVISVRNIKPYKTLPVPGMSAPRCKHCKFITNGANVHPKMLEAEAKILETEAKMLETGAKMSKD